MIYSAEIEANVKEVFERKQADARYQISARREKIYSEIPQIKELEEKISKEGIKLTMSALNGQEYVAENDMSALAQKRDALMKEYGYSPDYINDVYSCKKCNDTGYVNGEMCECMKKEYQKFSFAYSNIASSLSNSSLEDFSLELYSEVPDENGDIPRNVMRYILTKSVEFIENFSSDEVKNLFFFGSTGLGKTFLSAAIAKKISEKGFSVLYFSAKQLLSMMTDYEFGKIPEKKELCESVYKTDLLIIDDLGSEQQTSYSISNLFDIINSRMLSGKKMIINTNLAAKDLHVLYSDRIFSRLTEFERLKFIGNDIRILKNI